MAITLTKNAARQRVAKAWKQWAAGYAQDLPACQKAFENGATGTAHGIRMDEEKRIYD